MMECPQKSGNGGELVVAYVARALDSGTEAAFKRHMEACATCREMAAAQQAVWTALDEWLPAPVSSNFDDKLYRQIASEAQPGWWQGMSWLWRPAVPVAAACAALLLALILKNPEATNAPAPQPAGQPKVQIEQVEEALDDMDMLKQAGVEGLIELSGTREKI